MTNPRLTDEAVGRLPLSRARAELLEDIMATTPLEGVSDHEPVRRPRRRGTLVAVGTAAATVAALFAVPALLDTADGPAPSSSGPVAAQGGPVTGDRLVLAAPGWTLEYTYEGDGELEASYVNGDQSVDLHRRQGASYDDYYEDRSYIAPVENDQSGQTTLQPTPGTKVYSAPPEPTGTAAPDNDVTPTSAPGEAVTLLGKPGEMWAYSADDHTTIGVVQDGWYAEVRGSGMDEAAYLALLAQVRAVSDAEYEAALPESFVSDAERRRVITEMTSDMTTPDGFGVSSDQSDRYQLGAEVSGAVACAWLDRWVKGRQIGDDELVAKAAAALAGAREWAVLEEMEPEGDYPEVLWEYVDRVEQGKAPTGYQSGLGCP